MPVRPLNRCRTAGCPGRVLAGRCERCKGGGMFGRQRGGKPEPSAVYTTARWRAFRLDYLTRHPLCVLCGRAATIPDHFPVSRRMLLTAGVVDPDADDRLRPLCTPCHKTQTALRQPGGWNLRA